MDGQKMRELAQVIEPFLPENTGFALVIFPFEGEERRWDYISNACREDMERALQEVLAKWKSGKEFPTPEAN